MRNRILTAILGSCLLWVTVHGQRPVPHPELLAGPWEFTDASGINGIFLRLGTHAGGTAAEPIVTSQSVTIGVYHRQNGLDAWGWYTAAPADASDAASAFDGQHLHIRNDGIGLLVDVAFAADTRSWTGTWLREGRPRDVVLERPHLPPDVAASRFTGDWDGLPEATGLDRRTRLHIAQSSDRAFTVWMDRFMLPIDQRHGELLRLESVDGDTITLETTNGAGIRDTYQATQSADGSTLVGAWLATAGSGRTLNASSRFRRAPQER